MSLADEVLQSSLDGFAVMDRESRYVLWNRAMERFAGKKAAEVLGRNAFEMFPFLREHGLEVAVERVLRGETVETKGGVFIEPDGTRKVYDRLYQPLRGVDGAIIGVVCIIRDETARYAAMDALREQEDRRRAAQRLEAVGELTAGIAHNFNNLLMGMLPNLEAASRRAPADIAPLIDIARSSAQDAAKLVEQLITYAGRNRPVARRAEVLAEVVERTVAFCKTTFDPRIALELRCNGEAVACIDARAIEQTTLNLLINARDAVAGKDAPRITVTVDEGARGPELEGRQGDWVRIEVADNGAGMDPAVLERIYEPFFTTKPVGKGTGLGLSTAHGIIGEHGGFMTCRSEKDRGSVFAVYLPSFTP